MKNKIKLAFIGCGNMAQAMIGSLTDPASAAVIKANGDVMQITVADPDEAKLMSVRQKCTVTHDNAAAVDAADYVVLAVKPQSAEAALGGIDMSQKTVISIMAGVSINKLASLTGAGSIVRVMPNLCARVGESFNAYAVHGVDGEKMRVVLEILGSFGVCREVSEDMLDAVTGITGSGPAFVFMTLKAFYDEAVAQGFSPEDAKAMAVQTVVGSALTAEKSEDGFDALIRSVCSKGGTTIEGVDHLNNGGYTDMLRGAIVKSIEKAKELNK